MRPHKSTILIMLFGLLLLAFVAVTGYQTPGQTTPQTGDQKKQAEACCAMESCCCKGDSCAMKKEGAEAGESCCGDSCKLHHADAKMAGGADVAKHDPAKHDPAKHDPAKHDGMKHEGCCGGGQSCCGESCDMAKEGANADQKTHKADGSCCKMKQKDAKKEAKSN